MTHKRHTLSGLANEILSLYRGLAGEKAFSEIIVTQTLLGRRLKLLTEIAAARVTSDQMTQDQAMMFQETLLDVIGLQYATGGQGTVYDSIHIKDPTLLGGSRDRRAKLRESDDAQLDWHFQILVQAWVAGSLGSLKDLRDDPRFKNRRACDFCLPRSNSRFELLECKRVHSATDQISDSIEPVVAKIIDRLPNAIDQMERTADVLGKDVCDLHLLIDISAYTGHWQTTKCCEVQVEVGGFNEEQLPRIALAVAHHCGKLSRLTLCWYAAVKLDGRYRAIIQRSKIVFGETPTTALLDYKGWTVEGYPRSNEEYCEYRVSGIARTIDWIVSSFNSLSSPETFVKAGPMIRVN
jgi:hypothetical protein